MNEGEFFSVGRRTLATVVTAGLLAAIGPSTGRAQETGGAIFGWAPAGQTVTITGVTSGTHRHVTVKDTGRYSIGRLPLGTYTVTLERDGKVIDTRSNIGLKVGRGAEVDFACPEDHCEKREEG